MTARVQVWATLAAITLLTSCSLAGSDASTSRDADTHLSEQHAEPVLMWTDGPLSDASLTEYADASDLVVRGSITDQEEGPQYDGQAPYTLFTVDVTEVLKGQAPDTLKVMMLTETEAGAPLQVDSRPELTGAESLWMLKAVDPMFERPTNEYVLTGNAGVLPGDQSGSLDIEVFELDPALEEALDLETLDAVAEEITGQ